MKTSRARSLQAKLMRLTILAVGLALLVTVATVAVYEVTRFRPRTLERVRTHARLIEEIVVPALEFDDALTAGKLLQVLRHEPAVEAAGVYLANGELLAAYRRNEAATHPPAAHPPTADGFVGGKIMVSRNVRANGAELGRVWLQADVPGWGVIVRENAWLMMVVAVTVAVLSLAIARSVRRQITDPLLTLAQTVRAVGRHRDFNLRVDEKGGDEIGDLAGSFNEMLAAIGERDRRLHEREERLIRQNAGLGRLARVDLETEDDFLAAMRQFTELAAEAQQISRVGVWLFDEAREQLVCVDVFDRRTGTHATGAVCRRGERPRFFAAVEAENMLMAEDTALDSRLEELRGDFLAPFAIEALLATGIRWRGEMAGVLCHEHVGSVRAWLTDEITFGTAVAEQISLLLERREALRADAALQQSEERYRRLINEARDAIFTLSADGTILGLNDAVKTITGWEPSLWIGRHFTEPLRPEDRETARRQLEAVLRGGRPPSFELQIRSREGAMVTFEFAVSPHFQDGRIAGLLGIGRDVSERRQAAEMRAKLEEQLRQAQKMEAIGNLAGGIAHDFNNILTGIIGHSQLAAMDLPPRHPAQESLGQALTAAHRAKDLIRQILTFSRRQEQRREPAQLEAIVADSMKLLRPAIPSSVEIRLALGSGLPPVSVDITQIHQVIVNLATNAAQAMEGRGGRLEIIVDEAIVDESVIQQKPQLQPGRYVRLWVTDTGCGMTPETQAHLFEPFFTTKEPGKGTGLGLAVVHGIVQQHEGAIIVYSKPDKGTSFQVYLPVVGAVPARPAPALAPAPAAGCGQRIMVVDDEDLILSVAEKILTRAGYRVSCFKDPVEALDVFRRQADTVDLVITDLTMPRIIGTWLAAEMRAVRAGMPVIITTGFGGGLDATGVKTAGLLGPLYKPFTNESLLEAVAQALAAGGPPA